MPTAAKRTKHQSGGRQHLGICFQEKIDSVLDLLQKSMRLFVRVVLVVGIVSQSVNARMHTRMCTHGHTCACNAYTRCEAALNYVQYLSYSQSHLPR